MAEGWLDQPRGLSHEELNISFRILPDYLSPVLYLSMMNIAAGLLAGRGGSAFLRGWGSRLVGTLPGCGPVRMGSNGRGNRRPGQLHPGAISDGTPVFGYLYGTMIRPLGIGTLIGGALMGVVVSFPAIKSAIRSLANASKTSAAGGSRVGSDELSLNVLIFRIIGAVAVFFIASMMTEGVTVGGALLSAIIGTIWLGLAGLIVAQATGMTDISPMSGMALISVTLMMFLLDNNVAGAMVVGVAVCVAIGQGADMMQDLKSGFLIGGRPVKQQVVQFGVTWIGAVIAIGAIYLLWQNGPGGEGGFGGKELPAPQAGALMGIIDGVVSGNVPVDKYVMGGVVGALLGAAPMAGLGF